ncbi:MAG: hypothetical protein HPY45_10510 [Anaerolineae bacterium]|nr:hypothetical protein [Anaerolineae bacterium]
MDEVKRFSLIKPTIRTPFHIDFEWWKQHDTNWRVHLQSCLCAEHQEYFSKMDTNVQIDYVDPNTAEVQCVDGIQHTLMTHCAKQPDFITDHTTLVDTVFRCFLSNGNKPLTPEQLGEQLGRSPDMILRTLSGAVVYKGIRPCQNP